MPELGVECGARRLRGGHGLAGRARRRSRGLHRPGARRRRATCATTRSSRRRWEPAATRSTPGTASSRRAPRSRRCAREHDLVFVGPPPEVIELAGDKLRAREEARWRGCRCCGGGSPSEARPPALPAAGEGGRWRWRPRDQAGPRRGRADALLSLARSEAGAAFGDERVYLERFIAAARHIEVQVAADAHGTRHRTRRARLLGAAPLSEGGRGGARSGPCAGDPRRDAARRRSRSRAGSPTATLGPSSSCWTPTQRRVLLPRVQLPHPGRASGHRGGDRRRSRVRAAADRGRRAAERHAGGRARGRPRDRVPADRGGPRARASSRARGGSRASRCRGRPGLRVDTHCEDGTFVAPYYDSLLAKLIAHGRDRAHAIAILSGALDGLECEGVATNRDLLARVLADRDYVAGAVTTTGWRGRCRRCWKGSRHEGRDRRHERARRQPEPLGRDRPDHARRARDRPGDGPRRLSRARLHRQHAPRRLGPLQPRGPLRAHPTRQRGDAEHAAEHDHDRDAVHLVGPGQRGRDGAVGPPGGPKRHPPHADRRPLQRRRSGCGGWPRWRAARASRRS